MYLYVTLLSGALVLGSTVPLFWGQLKPIERVDIFPITLFPVVALLAAAVHIAKSSQLSISILLPKFILLFVLYCTFISSYVGEGDTEPAHNDVMRWMRYMTN